MNKGPLFNKIRKYLKSVDKKWTAPSNIKKENIFVFLKRGKKETLMIRVTYNPEINHYKVHQFVIKNCRYNDNVAIKVDSIEDHADPDKIKREFRGKWKSSTSLAKGHVVTKNKKGQLRVLDCDPKIRKRKGYMPNCTYKNDCHIAENVYLLANGDKPSNGGLAYRLNPVLADTPYTQRSVHLKFPDLKALFHYYKVKGKVLRKWTLNGDDENFVKKLLILRGFSNVSPGLLQSFTEKFPRLYVAKPDELKKLRRFNSESLMRDVLREFKAEEGYEHFKDLGRLERQYRKEVGKKLPEVRGLWQYHMDLVTEVIAKQFPNADKPFKLTANERALNNLHIAGYTIKVPECQLDLIKWGQMQVHCIGTHVPNARKILLSFWKDNRLISCARLQSTAETYNEQRGLSTPVWRVAEHRGFRNRPPRIANETVAVIEKAILETLNCKEEKEANEKVLR